MEQILFIKGKRGPEAWRYGPASILSFEVPEPQTERLKPGQVAERKEGSFKDRLLKELDGKCVYCGNDAVDKDHIFPRSKGGPDLWDNLVATCKSCNDAKGDRTPFHWFGSDAVKWRDFSKRVESLPVSPRKKQLLLNDTADFLGGDPTPLARVGARPRQFVAELRTLFESYGVPEPRLNYERGKCHVQLVRGRLTSKLRESWRVDANGKPNFPSKNSFDLYNHAQDAALVAACPPHTWRDRIFIMEGERPGFDGAPVIKPGLAISELAPSWAAFMQNRKAPILRIVGNYPVTWKRSVFKETLWQGVDGTDDKALVVYEQVKDLTVKEIAKVVSPHYRERLKSLAEKLGLSDKKNIPAEVLKKEFPDLVRLKVTKNKPSGVLIKIPIGNGPARKMAVAPESASEGAVFWILKDGRREKLNISIIRPRPLQTFGVPRFDPPIPKDAIRIGTWRRHQLIELPKGGDGKHPAGWYRVKEFSNSGVIVLPENALPAELANRMQLGKRIRADENEPQLSERSLGKKDLKSYFATIKKIPE